VIIILPIAAVTAALLTFDPNAYKGQMAEAASQALGRPVTIAGPVAVKLSLIPTLSITDVRIANIPGGAAPLMARIRSIETRIALLPLLHHEIDIDALVLRHPTILLEKTADGGVNWTFQPQSQEAAGNSAATKPVTVNTGHGPWQVSVHSLDIEDGTIDWRNEATRQGATLGLRKARVTAEDAAGQAPETAPLDIAADLVWQNQSIKLTGKTGPIAHLTNPADQSNWPVQFALTSAGASLSAQGGITDPRHGRGYNLNLQADIPALEAVTPLLPAGLLPNGTKLPPLHGVVLAARLQDSGQGTPRVSNLSLQAQASDLGGFVPGLKLDSLSLVTPAPDQPVSVNILGDRQGLSFTLSGSVGPVPMPGGQPSAPAPLPVDLMLTAAQSTLHAQGTIGDPWALKGINLALSAQIANLAYLSPLAGSQLPAFTILNGTGTLIDETGGLSQGFTISGLNLTAPQGDLEGAIGLAFAPRFYIGANLRSARLDLDSVFNAAVPVPAAPPASPAPTPPAATKPAASGAAKVIPDVALPVADLKNLDARANLAFASLRLGGTDYRALVAKAELANGVFSLDPSSVVVP
ncbi:MAG TPA: AsmA family protein, partial [Acidisoma sp.]|nr:AsmA family protein [Acidisoma sp.]